MVSGLWFEELTEGLVVEHAIRRTVTETDNLLFTTTSMNSAAPHLDAEYAAASEFSRPLVNSMFTAALVVGISVPELTLGTIVAQLGLDTIVFPAPAFTATRSERSPKSSIGVPPGPARTRGSCCWNTVPTTSVTSWSA